MYSIERLSNRDRHLQLSPHPHPRHRLQQRRPHRITSTKRAQTQAATTHTRHRVAAQASRPPKTKPHRRSPQCHRAHRTTCHTTNRRQLSIRARLATVATHRLLRAPPNNPNI